MLADPPSVGARTVSAKDAVRNWKEVTDEALRGPVVITAHGRPRHVLLGYEDYVNLRRQVRQALSTADLSPELTDSILTDLRSAIGRRKDGDVVIE